MELRRRVQRRQWILRCGQAVLAAAAGASAFGLTAAAEGLPAFPWAICGGVVLAALVLAVARPWQAAIEAVDPAADEDGLLRTALSRGLSERQGGQLQQRAAERLLHLRPLPEWQAWGLCLASACAAAGWVLVEPPPVEQAAGFGLAPGMRLDGSLVAAPLEGADPAGEAEDSSPTGLPPAPAQDGGEVADTEQWVPVAAPDGGPAVGLGLDLGLEQQVYERYLRNRSKRP
ncbi:MAG: hypothetical protein ACYSU1_01400 [Planctomycetota bacterium]